MDLRDYEIDIPADYHNKKHNNVFRIRQTATGGEYLFETANEVSFFPNFLNFDDLDNTFYNESSQMI